MVHGRYTLISDAEGKPQRSIISYENVTEQHEKELAYQKWIQTFKDQQENSIGYYEFNLTKNIYEGNERRNSGASGRREVLFPARWSIFQAIMSMRATCRSI